MSVAPPLPGILAEIEATAGREAALGIALAHGGDDGWYVPRRLHAGPGRELVELVGQDAAEAIVRRFGGGAVSVPLARRALVGCLARHGLSTTAIASRLRISRRTARRYRRLSHESARNP